MPIMRREDLTALVAMIDRQLERKKSLEARERSLEKQLEKWRVLLVEKMAYENQQECTCCVCGGPPYTPTGPSGSRFASPSRPKSSRGHRRSRSPYDEIICPATLPTNLCSCSTMDEDATFEMTTQWKNDMFGASSRPPPPSQTMCLCSEEGEPVLAQLASLADDEIRIRAAIQETETRIMTTCNAICALKQVVREEDLKVGSPQVDKPAGTKQEAVALPSTAPVQQQLPDTAATQVANTTDVAVKPDDALPAPSSSIKEASADLDAVQKSLDGAEKVVESHTSKDDLSKLKESLNDVEVSIMSAHFNLAAEAAPGERLDSIVSYKTPAEVIEFWNEIETTKHRLSVLVKHSKECKICKDVFKPTFQRIDEELLALSADLRNYHTNNPA